MTGSLAILKECGTRDLACIRRNRYHTPNALQDGGLLHKTSLAKQVTMHQGYFLKTVSFLLVNIHTAKYIFNYRKLIAFFMETK